MSTPTPEALDEFMFAKLDLRNGAPVGRALLSPEMEAETERKAKDPTYEGTFMGIDIYRSPRRYVCGDWHWPRKGSK